MKLVTTAKVMDLLTSIKTYLNVGFGIAISFVIPIWGFLLLTLILVMIDTKTGISAAKIREEKINSKGLRRTTEKFKNYALAILAAQALYFFMKVEPSNEMEVVGMAALSRLTYVVTGWIAIHEIKSIFENIKETTGLDLWSKVRGFIPNFSKKSNNDKT